MNDFFPGQRHTSKGEPELGVGIVKEISKGRVQVFFPLAKETRLYASESEALQRVVFKAGDTITDTDGSPLLITQVQLEGSLYTYYGAEGKLSEADLGDVSAKHNVDDRLFNGDVDAPRVFALRRATLQHEYNRRISPVNGFLGGRIDLIPHQLYIANEVSSRYAPRVLLSDQVGLGKTIEACLILHRLLLRGQISRVLILVPESLLHQWFVEVLRRFNMWFNIFDEERCAALDEGAPDGNPFLDNQLIICSTEFLAGSAKRTRQALAAQWDMLVVDEAHNLEWSVDQTSPEYAVVELLSKVAKGLLLLTATPEQLGIESHFARLRLLDPNRYASFDDFAKESANHKNVALIAEKLQRAKDLQAADLKALEALFSKERIEALSKGGEVAKDQLIEDLLDQHGPGRVIFRNTRAAMSGFPKRRAHLVPLKASTDHAEWSSRLSYEFANDLEPKATSGKQNYHFDTDPRVKWLLATLKQLRPAKVLLICKSKEKVLALEEVLAHRENQNVGIFHEDLTILQRDRNAAWFTEKDGAQILLCSEIGSEGRNFQFAQHLILFDVPLNPELLEQRIGRLDRIGQTGDIHIHVPYLEGTPQQALIRWFHEGLNAFENNLEGGNKFFQLFGNRLLNIAKTHTAEGSTSELATLIAETSSFQKELQKSLADGRDRLLEMNSFRPKVSKELIAQIEKEDSNSNLETYLTKIFTHFGMDMEDLSARTYYLQPSSVIASIFPAVPKAGLWVTFNRKRALSREDMSFLSWDHPITTDAIDMMLSSETGNASFGILRGTGTPGLLLELLFVLETSSGQNLGVDRFLPNTPIRIVVDHTGNEVTEQYPIDLLDKKLIAGQIAPLLDNDALVETIIPNMISLASESAQDQSKTEIAKGLKRMNERLNHEIARLERLQEKNQNIRPEEIQLAKEERATLTSIISDARVRMDAIQLIRQE